MNFFEQQAKSRSQSRWIIFAFIVTTLFVVCAVNITILMFASLASINGAINTDIAGFLSWQNIQSKFSVLAISSAVTASIILFSSFGKTLSLRSGGGKVAQSMGGVLVTPDTKNPLRRRLYNVVEEIAIASGIPVPDVYVMENESAINAFAAGYTPADAAVAVTQGTLEKLDRNELQGVIAHEFSHIFNGDMRINIRMIGVVFGITVIALIGRWLLSSQRYRRSSNGKGNPLLAMGVALLVVGYIGLFFSRWMKSALSRQREYLADATAVQFTRNPAGIAGALKKIAAYEYSSYLEHDTEEVSHMLFSSGMRSFLFATHPPLEKRIRSIEKNFNTQEIKQLAEQLKRQDQQKHYQTQLAEQQQAEMLNTKQENALFDVVGMIDNIGNPELERILAAAVLSQELPKTLTDGARSLEWAPEVLFFCLLDKNRNIEEKQYGIVLQKMGDISESKLRHLYTTNRFIEVEARLPLFEICFPAIKRRPIADIEKILETIHALIWADECIEPFEYLLSRLISMYVREAANPSQSKPHGNASLKDCQKELADVVSIMALYNENEAQGVLKTKNIERAQDGFKKAMEIVGIDHLSLSLDKDWQLKLDKALYKLDQLKLKEKSNVIKALTACIMHDQKVVSAEHELLRVISALIHVPLPILGSKSAV